MIIKDRRKIRLALHQRAALCARAKRLGLFKEPVGRQTFRNVEDLFGIFLVCNELTEVPHRLKRTEFQPLAAWVGEVNRCHDGENDFC